MTVVGKVSFDNSGVEIDALKQAIANLRERVQELELIVFAEIEADPLEEAHQRFAANLRAHRERGA